MKRLGGVIASGVIAIIGSVLTSLFGIAMVASSITMRSASNLPEGIPATVLLIESIVFVGLGIFGIVCAVALLMLKNWARISFLVFAGILSGFSAMATIGTVGAMFLIPQMIPPEQAREPGVFTFVLAFLVVFCLLLAALSVWWLIYFTRRKVKEQFLSEGEISIPRRGPISVTIIAWLLVVGGCLGSLSLLVSFPVMIFGIILHGWMARALLALFAVVGLVAGVGMLRWRPQAHSLALVVYGFGLLSTVLSLILPGSAERMQTLMQEMAFPGATVPNFSASLIRLSWLMGMIAIGVPIWFLVTQRRAFLEACKAPPSAGGTPTNLGN